MKKSMVALILAVGVVSQAGSVFAEEAHVDPLKRNLIFVEGMAEITVPINAFSLVFGFDIDKISFNDARSDSERIIEKISSNIRAMDIPNVEIIRGWDLVKQAKVSFMSKGRKISNRVTVKVVDFPAGKMHELIARMIDDSLAVDNAVFLEDVDIYVTEEIQNQKKQEVLTEALKTLKANAERSAEALGSKVAGPKRVFISSAEHVGSVMPVSEDRLYDYELASEQKGHKRSSLVSINKGFKVRAQIVDNIKISAQVTGIYEIA
ncbi:MAG: SIMPL domain-containing protein [Candidatus Omnitrophica bacterium]|nr:SIMPL domain-containing protein [Candidatus Omnitrophota bacterium]MDD5670160.1 SIMPL domain-containing protein [Candidatus Omnitrophota bacterium]